MLQFNTDGNNSQNQQSRTGRTIEPSKQEKQQQLQEQRAKNHWGIEIKESNVDTMLNLMFNHLGDPHNSPNPMQDPMSRR